MSTLQPVVLVASLSYNVVALEEPQLGLGSDAFSVSANAKFEVTVGDEVRKDEFCG